ncbi:sulfate ABC transporter permease [Camelimonas fluminis]|uniref:Sulfate transport system permease protein CysT n=1 Tax=Camelimonas fluminis TaxID=1576911 RepID=A0ABV7UNM2_9HYPH|nr:sulfate ABC transporter permease subunit CysT [Camelimonas fluminis]GHE56424.1 sulfate ABC transporter permease [Camelimonas fluminis]
MSVAAAAAPARRPFFRKTGALPGFGLALGYALTWLGLIVLLPLAALFLRASSAGLAGFAATLSDPRVQHALLISFGVSAVASIAASLAGLVIAWALTRYDFPGRRVIDAMVDLPFALPTAVAGIALAALYAPDGLLGAPLARLGWQVVYNPIGIFIAMVFIGLPYAVRTVQPLIAELDRELEEAAATLGASRLQTVFQILAPPLIPAALTGLALAFARALGEYGSVIFIAGNLPGVSEIAPLLIVIKLSEFDYTGATVIAVIMLIMAFLVLLIINLIQAWSRRRMGNA